MQCTRCARRLTLDDKPGLCAWCKNDDDRQANREHEREVEQQAQARYARLRAAIKGK